MSLVPAILPTIVKSNGQNSIILKFWKWESKKDNSIKKKADFPVKHTKSIDRPTAKFYQSVSELKNLEPSNREMLQENRAEFQRFKRTIEEEQTETWKMYESHMHVISETLVAVIFNKSEPFIQTLTDKKLVQICEKGSVCEPDVHKQMRSRECLLLTNSLTVTFFKYYENNY